MLRYMFVIRSTPIVPKRRCIIFIMQRVATKYSQISIRNSLIDCRYEVSSILSGHQANHDGVPCRIVNLRDARDIAIQPISYAAGHEGIPSPILRYFNRQLGSFVTAMDHGDE